MQDGEKDEMGFIPRIPPVLIDDPMAVEDVPANEEVSQCGSPQTLGCCTVRVSLGYPDTQLQDDSMEKYIDYSWCEEESEPREIDTISISSSEDEPIKGVEGALAT